MSKMALIQFGYQTFAVPMESLTETLKSFADLRKVASRYETGGYVYWYDGAEDSDVSVTIVPAARIHDTEPGKAPPPTATAKHSPDERLIAAPSDSNPISIRRVPPMRDFVDRYRDGETTDALADQSSEFDDAGAA